MRMLRTIRLDASDEHSFPLAAHSDEWAVPGIFAFNFSNEDPAELTGKARQAFVNGFLGLTSFGRSTLATVAQCQRADYDAALQSLTEHLMHHYGAPGPAEARRVAEDELTYSLSL